MQKFNLFFIVRLLLGLLYVSSGIEKLMQPYENFVYVLQGYDIVHNYTLERIAAFFFPWIEFFLGVFLLLGLWIKLCLWGYSVLSLTFIVVVSQAIVRKLQIDNCGCFGDLVHMPLHAVIILDVGVLVLAFVLYKKINLSSYFSLDHYYSKR
ncbi:MAG: DoxX family membrane protein [Candidatus Omnitrophica bacterium]|nr:DoxX family membrane protein [Candidatus Omnitrophota bacterium]